MRLSHAYSVLMPKSALGDALGNLFLGHVQMVAHQLLSIGALGVLGNRKTTLYIISLSII